MKKRGMKKGAVKKRKNTGFERIINNIKNVRIQGATNIAKAGIKAFFLKPKEISEKKAVMEIISARETEPLLQNALRYIIKSKNKKKASAKFLNYIKISQKKLVKKGSFLIKNNMNVFTHCHSSTVISILKEAKKRKKKFVVYTAEVEPLFQGRMTAHELADFGIKVIVSPDLAAEQMLKKCDIFLFGADAFLKKGIANKIGTSILCRIAKEFNIPRYSCGISSKYARKIKLETRSSREVWDERNKKIEIINPAFDFVKRKFISKVVSEFGILPYRQFIKKAKENMKKWK